MLSLRRFVRSTQDALSSRCLLSLFTFPLALWMLRGACQSSWVDPTKLSILSVSTIPLADKESSLRLYPRLRQLNLLHSAMKSLFNEDEYLASPLPQVTTVETKTDILLIEPCKIFIRHQNGGHQFLVRVPNIY